MCGICGIVNGQSKEPVAAGLIAKMMHFLEHRGPDDQGIYLAKEVGLGFQRLSIIDLVTGNQPIANETGDIWLVFNGEIWNYRPLRAELIARGHVFRSHSSSQVVF